MSLASENPYEVRPEAAKAGVEAGLALQREDFAEAKRLSEEAVRLAPEFAEAWVGRGFAACKLKDFPTAQASYEEALRHHRARYQANSSHSDQLTQQAFVLVLLNRQKEGEALLQEGLVRHPGDPLLLHIIKVLPEMAGGLFKPYILPAAP